MPRDVYVPVNRVVAIYARENGQGMAFEVPRQAGSATTEPRTEGGAPTELPRTVETRGTGLVPIVSMPVNSNDETRPPTPSTPKPGDRPKLTRVK